MKTLPLLNVVILNNNRCNDTLACLESLSRNDYKNIKITLLDNSSTDDSLESVQEEYPEVQIVPLRRNLGYAGNNNIGIKMAIEQDAEWILVLNDDTVLDPSCLSSLMNVVMSDSDIGIVGPMVYHFDEPNIIQSAGGMLGEYWDSIHLGQNEPDHGQFQCPQPVQWISGCAILIRGKTIEQVGMLDPDYFLYWEEVEWCVRAGKAGWKIIHVPNAKLWHKGVKRNYQPGPYVTYYFTRNQLLTLAKHKAPIAVWVYIFFKIIRTLVSWTIKPRWRFKREHRNAMWWGLIDFLQHHHGPMPSRS